VLVVGVKVRVVEVDEIRDSQLREPAFEAMRQVRNELGMHDDEVVVASREDCAQASERGFPKPPPLLLSTTKDGSCVSLVKESGHFALEAVRLKVGQILTKAMTATRRLRRVSGKNEDAKFHRTPQRLAQSKR